MEDENCHAKFQCAPPTASIRTKWWRCPFPRTATFYLCLLKESHSLEHAFFHTELTFSRFCWQNVSPVQVVSSRALILPGWFFPSLPSTCSCRRHGPNSSRTITYSGPVTHLKPLLILLHILSLGTKVKKVQMPKAPKLIWLELSFNFFNLDFAHFPCHFLAFADLGPRRGRPIESGTYVILEVILCLFASEAKSFSIFCRAVPEDTILKL